MVIKTDRSKGFFTTLSNCILWDENISLEAKGLFAICVSENQDTFDFSVAGLAKICHKSEPTIRKLLKELIDYGYVERYQTKQPDGRMGKSRYIFYERGKAPFTMPQNIHLTQREYDDLMAWFAGEDVEDSICRLAKDKEKHGDGFLNGRSDYVALNRHLSRNCATQAGNDQINRE